MATHLLRGFFLIIFLLFVFGWIGCAITIPMAGIGYFSVLWKRDDPQKKHEYFD